jgi:hypothetical protein
MTHKRHHEGAERRLTVDPGTVAAWLISVFGANAGTVALHHAFVGERGGPRGWRADPKISARRFAASLDLRLAWSQRMRNTVWSIGKGEECEGLW